jgi:hypothetical protein
MEKIFDFKNKLELWRWYVYEEKSKMISTSINKKESRL